MSEKLDQLNRWMNRAITTAGRMRAQGNAVGERYYSKLAAGYLGQYLMLESRMANQ